MIRWLFARQWRREKRESLPPEMRAMTCRGAAMAIGPRAAEALLLPMSLSGGFGFCMDIW